MVCRSTYNHIKANGFVLRTLLWGNGRFVPDRVLEAGSIHQGSLKRPYDYIVLANKIKSIDDTYRTIKALEAVVCDETTLVSVQNGMDNEVPWRLAFANTIILSAVCNVSCSQNRSGFVEQTAAIKPHAFHLGIYNKGKPATARDWQKLESLATTDVQFRAVDNIIEEKWQKLIFNSAWNSMTAIAGVDTHELLRCPSSIEIVQRLAEEALRIGNASGVRLADVLPERIVEVAKESGSITTSTLRDVRKGRRLETLPISGRFFCI